jgi:23S rRNA (cytidine1920-2'-O)/16S rRNA (cytidine1409-2'-O)-methyltransferase
VRRGLAPSRERAREEVENGHVLVGGSVATKPARLVDPGEPIEVTGPGPRFVGRGGEKLDAALDRFAVDVAGRRCLDAGASTGGFTDCLLQRGAAQVLAVDVGYGQLHERLRSDPRVRNLERTNIRDLPPEPVDLVVADLSFISLRTVLPDLLAFAGDLVLLVKPQFEAGRQEASKGKGVIRDADVWRRVLGEIRSAASDAGAAMIGAMPSPIRGQSGNVEFLVRCRRGAPEALDDAALDAVVAEVGG